MRFNVRIVAKLFYDFQTIMSKDKRDPSPKPPDDGGGDDQEGFVSIYFTIYVKRICQSSVCYV